MTSILLSSFDLSQGWDKFRLILAMLNMARLFNRLVKLCPRSAETEYMTYERDDGVVWGMDPKLIVKDYSKTDLFQTAVQSLAMANAVLIALNVPHVETLVKMDESTQR